MKKIEFLAKPIAYFDKTEFIAYLPKVEGEEELFAKLKEILKLPDYFGNNWNALYDCLRDFSWLEKKGIVLVHIEIPELFKEELKTYLEILIDVVQDWKENEEHYFKIIFPEESEQSIKQILDFHSKI